MKKLLVTTIVVAIVASLGAAFAQSSQQHQVEVRIPNVLMIRITTSPLSNAVAINPAVTFDFVTDPTAYLAALDAGSGTLAPTDVTNFGDVRVLANRGTWRVNVLATALVFNSSVTPVETAAGLALSDIGVTPPAFSTTTGVTSRLANWNLATTADIAVGTRTQGWRSLGFTGNDYHLFVNGDEAPGTFTTTVTYTIAAP